MPRAGDGGLQPWRVAAPAAKQEGLRGARSGSIGSLPAELRAREDTYNRVRPHQALGYLTPAEFLASLGLDV